MTKDPALELRLSRFDNEIVALYEIIDEFRRETSLRFAQVDARFDQVDARFDQVDARFERIDDTLVEVLRRLPEPA